MKGNVDKGKEADSEETQATEPKNKEVGVDERVKENVNKGKEAEGGAREPEKKENVTSTAEPENVATTKDENNNTTKLGKEESEKEPDCDPNANAPSTSGTTRKKNSERASIHPHSAPKGTRICSQLMVQHRHFRARSIDVTVRFAGQYPGPP